MKDITTDDLSTLMAEKGMKQKDLGQILELTSPKTSALMNGNRKISNSEQKLLKLYFYGEMPFDLIRGTLENSKELEFTEQEWSIITTLSIREGYSTPQKWIVAQIRGYLRAITHLEQNKKEEPTKLAVEQENNYNFTRNTYDLLAAAGSPIMSGDIQWDNPNGIVKIKAAGDSMVPLVENGGILEMKHISKSRSPYMKKGLIYLVCIEGGHTIKKYGTRPATKEEEEAEYLTQSGTVGQLLSLNKSHPPIDITTTDFKWEAWYESK